MMKQYLGSIYYERGFEGSVYRGLLRGWNLEEVIVKNFGSCRYQGKFIIG